MNFLFKTKRTIQAALAFSACYVGMQSNALAVNVVNYNFDTYNGGSSAGLAYNLSTFTSGNNPTSYIGGWKIATENGKNALGFIYAPGTYDSTLADNFTGGFRLAAAGSITASQGNTGGNFLAVDGDPGYNLAIYQTFTNLVAGATYTVSFYQAAGQQYGFTGATTEDWQVSFTAGDPDAGGTAIPLTALTAQQLASSTTTKQSTIMNNPSQSFTSWQAQSMSFVATSATETLSFLSQGTPVSGAPPIVMLDGVSLSGVTASPEPATFGFGALALSGLVVAVRRRNSKA